MLAPVIVINQGNTVTLQVVIQWYEEYSWMLSTLYRTVNEHNMSRKLDIKTEHAAISEHFNQSLYWETKWNEYLHITLNCHNYKYFTEYITNNSKKWKQGKVELDNSVEEQDERLKQQQQNNNNTKVKRKWRNVFYIYWFFANEYDSFYITNGTFTESSWLIIHHHHVPY